MAAIKKRGRKAQPQARRKSIGRNKAKGSAIGRKLAEALEQQAATAEILKVISRSAFDLQAVLDTLVESAARVCRADKANIALYKDDRFQFVAFSGFEPEYREYMTGLWMNKADRGSITGRTVLEGRTVHIPDVLADPEFTWFEAQKRGGYRTGLGVPLLREGTAIGVFFLTRAAVDPFTQQQIGLVTTFADQAVIAIENVRLFNETKEALERQTATAEILKVIASSPSDVQPVFDTIARNAVALCGCLYANVFRFDGELLHWVASHGLDGSGRDAMARKYPMRPDLSQLSGRAMLAKSLVYTDDTRSDPDYDPALAAKWARRMLGAPMLRDGNPVGAIVVGWAEPGTTPIVQQELLKTFADQAVIAIENVRLFKELEARNQDVTEALEQQQASAEVLRVISSSVADTRPVFDTILQSCERLFAGLYVGINVVGEDGLVHLAGFHGRGREEFENLFPTTVSMESGTGAAILLRQVMHYPDTLGGEDVPDFVRRACEVNGARAVILAPMLWEDRGIGAIYVGRDHAGPFSEKEIALLKTFADQAVIAIQNARLFNETKEALRRQTATAEVLDVISRSQTDVQPVFETIAANALNLCDAFFSHVTRFDGELIHLAAIQARAGEHADALGSALRSAFPMPPGRGGATARAIMNRAIAHVPDVREDSDYSFGDVARKADFQSILAVPMLRAGSPIGAITVARHQPIAFPEQQIALLKTFADQAVIAIENVRLFNETKEALEQQTAISEILRVMSGSPSDVTPVLEAVSESAMRICESTDARIFLVEGDKLRYAAGRGDVAWGKIGPTRPIDRGLVMGRAVLDKAPVHIEDLTTVSEAEYPLARQAQREHGHRTTLAVPLLRESHALGVILLRRNEVRSFTEKQISLLKTFAHQAAIAIENVRLFNETREALERQTATAEILRVISSSPTDVQPVFDGIVQSGLKLFCGLSVGLLLVEKDMVVRAAYWIPAGFRDDTADDLFPMPIRDDVMAGRAILRGEIVHVPDILEAGWLSELSKRWAQRVGARAEVVAPMMREGKAIGAIAVVRAQPGAFKDNQIALLNTFADQAVIAIENVRLFKELEARTAALAKSVNQLTALGEVGQAISSTLDLETVLQTIVARAVQLSGLDGGSIYEYDEQTEEFRLQAAENMDEELADSVRKAPIRKGDGAVGRTGITREPTQVPDIHDESYQSGRRDLLVRAGYRAVLAVPLLREDHIIGALAVTRKTPGPFAPEIVELLKTFATQSALAIQNARLFREIAEKGRQLEVASRHKSEFLASMSHELRTPLNAILGFNEMLLGQVYGEVPADMQAPLAEIQSGGKHLLRLINNVLDLAKIEAGRMELALSDYSVQDTVEAVRSTLRPLAADKGLEFLATVPADIPLAYGDPGRISQCLVNLAGNSLKFTKAGKVEISVEQKDGLLTYRVSDTGIGIPPEKIASLFTEFKQTDATIASEYGGTGLGLSISKKFIEMHGGRIWVESELGKGSSFIFEVPLRVKGQTAGGAPA